MEDSKREFRVGLMVFVALAAVVAMVFRFGDIGESLKPGMPISIILPSAVGILPQTPVHLRGIPIGCVQSLELMRGGKGVEIAVRIDPGFSFPADSTAHVNQSLLGDAVIEVKPGPGQAPIEPGSRITGRSARNPTAIIASVEQRLSATLASFERTGEEWGRLAGKLNDMLEASDPDGVSTLQQTSVALQQFTRTMQAAEETLTAAGSLLNDPHYRQQLQDTMTALPQLLNETRTTLGSVSNVVRRIDTTVATINEVTTPLAQHSERLATDLAQSMHNIQTMTRELAVVSRMMNRNDGSLQKLLTDPEMYNNLNRTSVSLSVLLQNLNPIVADLQVFSDKIARHPELLGVRGIIRGSDGVKQGDIRPAGHERRPNENRSVFR